MTVIRASKELFIFEECKRNISSEHAVCTRERKSTLIGGGFFFCFFILGISIGNSAVRGVLRDLARTSHRTQTILLDPLRLPRDVLLANVE